jgi:hypothetical protein
MGTQQIEAVPVALYAKNVNLLDDNNTIAIGGVVSATNSVAIGRNALAANTTGSSNTAIGSTTLYSNTTGDNNIAIGGEALYSNTTGHDNTAIGGLALNSNTTAIRNTASGFKALFANTTGNYNTANGYRALFSNTTGGLNTATGKNALLSNTTGDSNSAFGDQGLFNNTTGSGNVANGVNSLHSNTTGGNNTAIGSNTLSSNTTGSNNTAIGNGADVDSNNLSNVTAIGYGATVSVSNTIQLGNSNVTLVQTSGTISATAFVGDGSGLTGVSGASYTNEILIHPHEVTTNASVTYPPGYPINLIPFPEGTGTTQGGVLIPLMMPSNWNKGNVSITFYWSCSAADGDIYFKTGARKYGTGDLNITYPVAGFDLTPSAAWTLYKHTFTQTVGDYNSNSSDDNLLIINFSRYGYQPSTYGDTNTGNMYIHGIKIGYSTN